MARLYIGQKQNKSMKIINEFAENILMNLKHEVPLPAKYIARKENKGYTLFFTESLKIFFLDNLSYNFFKEIDGKKNCGQIAQVAANSTKLPYIIACNLLKIYLKSFAGMQIISIKSVIEGKSISSKFIKKFIPAAPDQIAVLLTNECNLRCSHCGNENRDKKENELSKEKWREITDQCAQMGVFIFNVSGGEPFIRKDWQDILSYAREKNIEVAITSNGTLINEDIVQKLKELNIFNIHLSLDGIGAIHDHFRNQKGVFDKVLQSINLLKKYNIPFGVTTAVSKRNFHNLEELAKFIANNNILSWEVYAAIPLGCMDEQEVLNDQELLEFAKKIFGFRNNLKNTKIFVGDNLGYFDRYQMQEKWQGCRAGISICAIDSEGNVKGCPIHPNCLIEGNLNNRTLSEIWNDKNSFSYNRSNKLKLMKQCKKCKFANICRGGCKASMYAQHKTFEYNDCCLKWIEEKKETIG